MNIEKLAQTLSDGEGYLVFSEENRRYFTGFAATDGWLVVSRSASDLLMDSRYVEAARSAVGCCEVALLKKSYEQISGICAELGITRLYIETDRLNVSEYLRLKERLNGIEIDSSEKAVREISLLRRIKTEEEISLICKAQDIAEKAFTHILSFIREGVTERDISLELDYFMLRSGAEALSFETIAVSGPNSSRPHGVPGSRKIQYGDFITMDYGAVCDGYHSDMTRTVAVGRADEKMVSVYGTVLSAQKASLDIIAPGMSCTECDKAARDIITAAGYGECFGHGTGHGVGIEIHESPSLSPRAEGNLMVGDVVTVEPGIYLPGEFGVRIEDMALVTENGVRNLTKCPKELIIV